jgi:hypothetical protein
MILPSCLTNMAFTVCFTACVMEVCLKPENVLLRLYQLLFSSINHIQLRVQHGKVAHLCDNNCGNSPT